MMMLATLSLHHAMGGVASLISPTGAITTTVQVTVHPTNPAFRVQGVYPRLFRSNQGLSESQWFSLVNAIQTGLGRGTEKIHGQLGKRLVCMMLSIVAVMVGFMAGFLCSFLGGVSENYAVLGVGIAFVVVFIAGLVVLLTSAVGVQRLQGELLQMGIANLDPLQRTLAESHPTVRVEAVNIRPPIGFQLQITILPNNQQGSGLGVQPQYPYPYGQQQAPQMNMSYPAMPGSPPRVSPAPMQGPYQPLPYYPGPPPPYYAEQPAFPPPNSAYYPPPSYPYQQGQAMYMGPEVLPVAQPVLDMYNQHPSAPPSHDEQHPKGGDKS